MSRPGNPADVPASFFDAVTRQVEIDDEASTYIDGDYGAGDFSAMTTAVAADAVFQPFEDDDDDQPQARTRVAKGSNPPVPIHAAMTVPMPRIEPTRVRLINPDNERQTGKTHIRELPESLRPKPRAARPRKAKPMMPPPIVAPPPPPIEKTELRKLEKADQPTDHESTELRPMTKPAGPYCPVGAPQLAAYQIVRQIAVGGMGIVYDAYHRASGQRVAVKYMRAAAAAKPELVKRFLAEAVAASRVDHSGVADIFDYGHCDNGIPYLVMEYLEGEPLTERLGRGPLSPAEFVAISKQIALILEAAHRSGIVHRDLKPDNIFLLAGDGPPRIKVLDFGVAKFQTNDLHLYTTQAGQMLGTPYYMSPEQCAGAAIDHRSDVYALGCVMYQMLTGRVPFSGNLIAVVTGHRRETPTPIASLNTMIPEALIQLIDAMMAKSVDDRPESMAEVAAALDVVVAGPPPRRRRESAGTSHPKPHMCPTIDSTPGLPLYGSAEAPKKTGGPGVGVGLALMLILAAAAAASIWVANLG